jgi:protein-arginine kinase
VKGISLKSYFAENRFNPKLLVIINEEDHLKIVCQDSRVSCSFTKTYETAINLLQALSSVLGGVKAFSRSPDVGILSPRPHEVGTGMRISARVQFTKLSSELNRLDYMCRLTRLQYRGTMGDGCIIKDRVVEISLKRKMGLSEAAQVDEFLRGLSRILDEDESCKDKCKGTSNMDGEVVVTE